MRLSITARAIVFIVTVCIALVALDVWRSWNARNTQLKEMETATSNLAKSMQQQADDALVEARTALVGINERLEVDGTGPRVVERLHRQLVERAELLGQLNSVFVNDEKGNWVASSQTLMRDNYNNSDRDYFIYHATHTDLHPLVGMPISSKTTGKWVIPVSQRFNHPDGSFAGVIVATVSLDYFLKFYEGLKIGKFGSVALISQSGKMIVRRPYSSNQVGINMTNTEIFKKYQTAKEHTGTAFIKSAQDGVNRLNSFRPLENFPFFAAAALSKDEILASWWNDTVLNFSVLLIVVMLTAAAGYGLVLQIKLRAKTEAELVSARDALEELNRTLEQLAMHDGLTGLANRRSFDTVLDNEFKRASRDSTSLALILIDLDRFKQYNDTYGHAAGDECLRAICRTIKSVAPKRPGDLTARYGGEELAVILPNTDETAAITLAEKMRAAVADLRIDHRDNPQGFVTLSAGVHARVPQHETDRPSLLIEAADQALYKAKSLGRNRVCASAD
jgi:diguanylate cyclase (GGDEF)-like protein